MPTTPSGGEPPDLMTIPEIAAYKGLTRQRIHKLATTDPAWPAPAIQAARTRVYRLADIDAYFEGREPQPGRRMDRVRAKAVMGRLRRGLSREATAEELGLSIAQVGAIEAAESTRGKRASQDGK